MNSNNSATGEGMEKKIVRYPALMHHEKLVLITLVILFFSFLVVSQFAFSIGFAWLISLAFATSMTLASIILTDNLITQVNNIFGKTLQGKINRNHLYKSLKLSGFPEEKVEFFLALIYAVLLFIIVITQIPNFQEFHWTDLPPFLREILLKVNSYIHMDMEYDFYIILGAAFLAAVMAAGLIGLPLFVLAPFFPDKARKVFYYPFKLVFNTFLTFHIVFKSIIKVLLFLIITKREFIHSIFYMVVRGFIRLDSKYFFLNIIEVEKLQFVRVSMSLLAVVGYLFLAISMVLNN